MPRLTKYLLGLLLFCFLVPAGAYACQCPVTSLDEAELAKYDIIFKGKIASIKDAGKNSEAVFTVNELYKGMVSKEFTLLFDGGDICKLELRPGDEWVIYANYHQIDKAKLDFCSRSRRYFRNAQGDFFEANSGVSYEDEVSYLQEKLGLHKLMKESPKNGAEHRNILPDSNQLIIGFVCSLLGLLLFYWLFNRFFK